MGTFYHELRANKARKIPTHFIIYDTETTGIPLSRGETKHVLKLGVACQLTRVHGGSSYREKWLTFYDLESFWSFVMQYVRSMSCVYLIAHNQHFDFPVVNGFNYLVKHGWEMSRPILDSNLFIVSFKKGHSRIHVLDSLNWFKFSLKTLGKYMGIPKLEIDFEGCSDKELEIYCHRDVEILKETMVKWIHFLEANDLGNFKSTIASQALSAYRHRFMNYPIMIHASKVALELERASYRGGRCECFYIGTVKEPVWLYDFNSLYPYIMQHNDYPTKLVKYFPNGTDQDLIRFLNRYQVIARVKIRIKEPFLAVRRERLIFPVGEFEVTLTTPELLHVLDHGEILEVYEFAIYNHKPILKDYVTELYKLRKGFKSLGNKVYELNTKLMLNSLYGKFGQRNEEIKEIGSCPASECSVEHIIIYQTHQEYTKWKFGGKIYVRFGDKTEWKHSFPAIASHVSAYARMELWKAMEIAGRKNVLYVDTDSLIVTKPGKERLLSKVHPTQLGKLKLEYEAEKLSIHGLKDYILGDRVRLKGVRSSAKRISENTYVQERFLKFRSLLRRSSLNAPITVTETKTLQRQYKKGVVQPDGSIIPYQLP